MLQFFKRFVTNLRRNITRTKALPNNLAGVSSRGGWFPIVAESFAGAWQQNVEVDLSTVLSFPPLYACLRLISTDVAKMRPKLMEIDAEGIWTETQRPAFSPVLRTPNHFQDWLQFAENWMATKLIHGNAYVLKAKDQRGVVVEMFVLDPLRCRPLVAPNGEVFYELKKDDLVGQPDNFVVVPASEVIHDRLFPLFHPLVGISPIYACGVAAILGLKIQENSALFFQNKSMPGGILTAPEFISDETAARLKASWEENFGGENVGRVAVLGDGLKYEAMAVQAKDSMLTDQWQKAAEAVCTAFGVPPYKIGVGPPPAYSNIQALNVQYYTDCLQTHVEHMEKCLDTGLGILRDDQPQTLGVELEVDDLLRMDSATLVVAAGDSIKASVLTPNEARKKFFGLKPLTGGDTVYLQQQQFSIEALAERDADKPFSKPSTAPAAVPAVPTKAIDEPRADLIADSGVALQKALEEWRKAA